MAETLDIDELLPKIGEFGRYQKLLLWLICLPACIPCSFCAFNQLFMANVPPHWCAVPELANLSAQQRKELAIPVTEGQDDKWNRCQRYAVNWTSILQNETTGTITVNTSWPIESCVQGWEYNKTEIFSSVVIDFDLVCDYDIYPTLSLVVLNIGSPVGVYIFGWINDRYGRRISFFSCLFTFIFGNILSAISTSYTQWTISRLIAGTTVPAIYQIPFIIALEFVGPSYRALVTFTTCIFYTFGLMTLAALAYLIRDWTYFTLATSLPFLIYFIYYFYLPESPRWLLAKGQTEKAFDIWKNIARVNNKPLPSGFRELLEEEIRQQKSLIDNHKEKTTASVFSLCRTPNMRIKTVLLTFNWFVNITTYVGLSYYGPALGNNEYLSFFLSSVVELPSYFVCWIIMDKYGRRWTMSASMIVSGVSAMATVLLSEGTVIETLILFLIAKSAISASLLIIYPFAGELFPTELRGIGMATASYVGGLGLIVIPYVTYLGSENLIVPLVVMGAMSVIGGLTSLRLPETLHRPLPQTIVEAEEFGKEWNCRRCLTCK